MFTFRVGQEADIFSELLGEGGRRGEGGEGESEINRHSEVSHSFLFK